MSNEYTNTGLVQEYLRRAKQRTVDISAEQTQGKQPGYVYRFGPKTSRRKKVSTFNIILFLFGFAVALVFYISNIIAVNSLVKEINILERQYDRVRNQNEVLQADLNKRTGLENIGSVATDRLGLTHPTEPPRWLTIDTDDAKKLQRELDKYNK
jgi:cell division protein FtsB